MASTTTGWMEQSDLALRLREQARHKSRLVSFTEAVPEIDPLLFFENGRKSAAAFYWECTTEAFVIVGIGSVATFRGNGPDRFQAVTEAWNNVLQDWDRNAGHSADVPWGAGPTLLGGFAFDPLQSRKNPAWQSFGDGVMTLPAIQLTRVGDQTYLTYNLLQPSTATERTGRAAATLDQSIDHLIRLRAILLRQTTTERSSTSISGDSQLEEIIAAKEWQQIVQSATEAIKSGAFQKTVLAREVMAHFDKPIDIEATLSRLRVVFPTACIFAVTQGKKCYICATPERLVQVRDNEVQTVALAGSAARGASPEEDRRLGEELLQSAKNRDEHAAVVNMLIERLQSLCNPITVPKHPRLLKLANVQHLYTPVQARLRGKVGLLDLVAQLHPTPALGGYPSEPAVAFIRNTERLDRGWYAGPVGWLSARGEGDFVVAIRSALIEDCGMHVHLYTGCGIVADSDPHAEYLESQWKLQGMVANMVVAV